jgi:hypothetical protein
VHARSSLRGCRLTAYAAHLSACLHVNDAMSVQAPRNEAARPPAEQRHAVRCSGMLDGPWLRTLLAVLLLARSNADSQTCGVRCSCRLRSPVDAPDGRESVAGEAALVRGVYPERY